MNENEELSPPTRAPPGVHAVMEIAKEIIDKHRVVEVDALYKAVKRRSKLPHKEIVDAIQFLLRMNYLVEGTRFTRETVLINPYRGKILDLIERQRAVHFSRIKERVLDGTDAKAGSSGQLIWHLEMLIKFKLIKKIKVKHYSVFIPQDLSDTEGKVHFLVHDGVTRKVLALLVAEGPVKKADVHKYIDEKREDVYYRIKSLCEIGIIAESETEGSVFLVGGTKATIVKVLENPGAGPALQGGAVW